MIKDALAGSSARPAVAELAKAFGLAPETTRGAVAHVVDELTRRLERHTLSRGGLADLVRAVGDTHHETYLRNPSLIGSRTMEHDGKAILDHILWSKDASRGVAARAARDSGVPAATIENMMPSIAALTMAELTRAAAGPFDDILRRIPGLDEALEEMQRERGGTGWSERRSPRGGSSGDFGAPGESYSPGEPAETLPPARRPDIATGELPEQRPLPIPGEMPSPDRGGSRYDDLSDILRRGGFRIPGGDGGGGGGGGGGIELPESLPGGNGGIVTGTLYNIVRAVLGALLGFQSRGLLGWLLRLVVLRWGWGFIQRILGRVLGRVLLGR